MSVTIHGIVCKNCWDVDWAKRVEAEDKKKADEEAAQKAKEANAPPGSKDGKVDASGRSDRASGLDSQPATIVDGKLKDPPSVDGSGAAAAVARSGHIGSTQSLLNILA